MAGKIPVGDMPEAPGLGHVGDGDNALAAGLEDRCDGHAPRRRREGPLLGGRRGGCPTTICPPLSAIPRTSQANSIDIADGRDISWSDMEGMSDDESHLLFHSDHHVRENAYAEPHMHRVRAEMARGEHYGSAFRNDTETAKQLVPTTRNNHHFGELHVRVSK